MSALDNSVAPMEQLNMVETDIHSLTAGEREIRVFICYRRQDGAWHADWLYRQLNNMHFLDADGNACHIRVYYDKTAPGISDWKQLHFPSLQRSQAMILVCTPGIAIDLSKRRQPDWVYEELRWWRGHRDTAPIVVDATSEGDRWLPRLITRKWPNINRIDLSKDYAATAEVTDVDFAPRIRERITGAIRESERRTVFEDLQRFKRLTKRLWFALSCALLLTFLAAGASVLALQALHAEKEQREKAEEQQKIAEKQTIIAENEKRNAQEQTQIAQNQKRIVQQQVIKLLFLPSTADSDEARDAFYTSVGGTATTAVLLTLINRTIENKLNRYGVINSLKILECFGPYRGDIAELALGKLYSELASINDEEVKTHLDNLRAAAAADLSNQPRPKESGYDRCQWVRDIITPK